MSSKRYPSRFESRAGFFASQPLSCVRLCDPMNRSMPGLPVHHKLPEFTETHVHRVSDAIQPSHPMLSPFPPSHQVSSEKGLWLENLVFVGSFSHLSPTMLATAQAPQEPQTPLSWARGSKGRLGPSVLPRGPALCAPPSMRGLPSQSAPILLFPSFS